MAQKVQSLLFPKTKFTPEQAKSWAKSHGYRDAEVSLQGNFYILQQFDIGRCEKDSLDVKEFQGNVKVLRCVVKEER